MISHTEKEKSRQNKDRIKWVELFIVDIFLLSIFFTLRLSLRLYYDTDWEIRLHPFSYKGNSLYYKEMFFLTGKALVITVTTASIIKILSKTCLYTRILLPL
jgi:hypothetical protein